MPSANVAELRAQAGCVCPRPSHARRISIRSSIWMRNCDLAEVTPELFQALQLLEPYGMGNPEPVFAARGVQLTAPPRILKDKHIKLKLRQGQWGRPPRPSKPIRRVGCSGSIGNVGSRSVPESSEFSTAAILATPRCHPDGAAIRTSEERQPPVAAMQAGELRTENRELRTENHVRRPGLAHGRAPAANPTPGGRYGRHRLHHRPQRSSRIRRPGTFPAGFSSCSRSGKVKQGG